MQPENTDKWTNTDILLVLKANLPVLTQGIGSAEVETQA